MAQPSHSVGASGPTASRVSARAARSGLAYRVTRDAYVVDVAVTADTLDMRMRPPALPVRMEGRSAGLRGMGAIAMQDERVLGRGIRVLGLAIRNEPGVFAIAVAGSVLFALLTIATAYVLGAVVGRGHRPGDRERPDHRAAVVGGLAAILGSPSARSWALWGRRLGAGAMQYRLQARYRREVTRRYLALPLSWHHRHPTGTLLSNANSDVESAWYPIAPFPFAVGTVVMLVAAIASLFVTDWVLALVGCTVFPALLGVNVVYSRRMAPRAAAAQRLRAEVSAIAHESFDGALVVKTMGREATETERFAVRTGELRDALIRVGRIRGLFDPILEALPSIGTLAVLLVGAWRLRPAPPPSSDVVSVAFLFTVLAFPVRAIGWVLAELPRSVVGWERVAGVLAATGDMSYGERTLDVATGPRRCGALAHRAHVDRTTHEDPGRLSAAGSVCVVASDWWLSVRG